MSGFMKTVLIITQPPWHFFSRKYTGFFTQWTTGRLSTHSLLTNLSSVWLAACRLLRLQGMASRVCPAKKISSLTNENTSLFDPPLPPGVRAWGTGLVWAGSQAPGLSAPTLFDGNPPGFSSTAKASLPAIAGRQARKFCSKFDMVFINLDICKCCIST